MPCRPSGFLIPFADSKGSVALVDPASGKAAWRTRLGTDLHDARVKGPRLFIEGANARACGSSTPARAVSPAP